MIKIEDLEFQHEDGKFTSMSIRMRDFKHNLPTNTMTINIPAQEGMCLVNQLLVYLVMIGPGKGPVFRKQDG